LLVVEAAQGDGVRAATGSAQPTSRAKPFVDLRHGLYQVALSVAYLLALDGPVRTHPLAEEAPEAHGVNRGRCAMDLSDHRLPFEFVGVEESADFARRRVAVRL